MKEYNLRRIRDSISVVSSIVAAAWVKLGARRNLMQVFVSTAVVSRMLEAECIAKASVVEGRPVTVHNQAIVLEDKSDVMAVVHITFEVVIHSPFEAELSEAADIHSLAQLVAEHIPRVTVDKLVVVVSTQAQLVLEHNPQVTVGKRVFEQYNSLAGYLQQTCAWQADRCYTSLEVAQNQILVLLEVILLQESIQI